MAQLPAIRAVSKSEPASAWGGRAALRRAEAIPRGCAWSVAGGTGWRTGGTRLEPGARRPRAAACVNIRTECLWLQGGAGLVGGGEEGNAGRLRRLTGDEKHEPRARAERWRQQPPLARLYVTSANQALGTWAPMARARAIHLQLGLTQQGHTYTLHSSTLRHLPA